MKKHILPLGLAACLLLAACGQTAPSAPSVPAASSAQSASAGVETQAGELEYLSASPDNIGYGAEGDQGFYYIQDSIDRANLHFIDAASGQDIVLCSNPSCTHDSDACPACFTGSPYLAFTGGKLFLLFDVSGSGEEPGHVDVVEPDGSGRRTVYTFALNQSLGGSVAGDGKNLYFLLATYEGDSPAMSLVRLNLAEGSLTELCKVDNSTFLMGVACGKLMLKTIGGESGTGGSPDDFYTQRHTLKAVDPATGEATPVLEWTQDEYWELVADDSLYLLSAPEGKLHLTVRDLGTGSDTDYDLPLETKEDGYAMSLSARNGVFMFSLFNPGESSGSGIQRWAFTLETGEAQELKLYDPVRGYPFQVMGEAGDKLVVQVPRYSGDDIYSFQQYDYVVCSWQDYLNSRLPE